MTTEELVNMDFEAFTGTIAELNTGSCERHARDLFYRLGAAVPFEGYVKEMARVAACFYGAPQDQFVEMYEVSKKHFPGVPGGYGILARLIALTVRMISQSLPPLGSSDVKKGSSHRRPG